MRHRRVAVTLMLLAALVGVATWMYGSTQAVPALFLPHTVLLSGQPVAIAVDTRTNRAFVATLNTRSLNGIGSVSVLDVRDGRLLRTVPIGQGAGTVMVDELAGRAFVNTRSGLRVLDARTGRVGGKLPVEGSAMAVDERANRVFAVGYGSGTMAILDARTGMVLHTVPHAIPVGDNAIGMSVDAQSGHVVVSMVDASH